MRSLLSACLLVVLVPAAHAAPTTVAALPGPAAEVTESEAPLVEAPRDPRDRYIAVGVQLGMAAPLGIAGIELTFRSTPHFEISVGAGFAWGVAPQIAVMPRLIAHGELVSAFIGAGLSEGSMCESFVFCGDDEEGWVHLVWANTEAGVEVGPRRRFVRVAVGASLVVVDGSDDGDMWFDWLPYTNVTAGYRF